MWTSTNTRIDRPNHFEINLRAVWGECVKGGGATSLAESQATMGMPSMNPKTFADIENQIGQLWGQLLKKEMLEAGSEERRLAVESGSFHEDVPCNRVIVDGGWSKRSHKHSYNAPSGAAVVIGARTGKLLYVGVRNKICAICRYADTNGKPCRDHVCSKNWGNSSASMEADILLEAFKEADTTLIGDGDSSVLHSLRTEGPPCRDIKKKECANHTCKGRIGLNIIDLLLCYKGTIMYNLV